MQAVMIVPTNTQGCWTPETGQDDPVGTVGPGHKLRFVIGTPGELKYVQINGTPDPALTRFKSVSDTGDWNPVKAENVVPVGIAGALGSNATTQQEPVPPPLPFKGSPKVADGAVYEVKMLMSKPESGQLTVWCPRNFGPPIPPAKLLASML
jgi:hypothetical protein